MFTAPLAMDCKHTPNLTGTTSNSTTKKKKKIPNGISFKITPLTHVSLVNKSGILNEVLNTPKDSVSGNGAFLTLSNEVEMSENTDSNNSQDSVGGNGAFLTSSNKVEMLTTDNTTTTHGKNGYKLQRENVQKKNRLGATDGETIQIGLQFAVPPQVQHDSHVSVFDSHESAPTFVCRACGCVNEHRAFVRGCKHCSCMDSKKLQKLEETEVTTSRHVDSIQTDQNLDFDWNGDIDDENRQYVDTVTVEAGLPLGTDENVQTKDYSYYEYENTSHTTWITCDKCNLRSMKIDTDVTPLKRSRVSLNMSDKHLRDAVAIQDEHVERNFTQKGMEDMKIEYHLMVDGKSTHSKVVDGKIREYPNIIPENQLHTVLTKVEVETDNWGKCITGVIRKFKTNTGFNTLLRNLRIVESLTAHEYESVVFPKENNDTGVERTDCVFFHNSRKDDVTIIPKKDGAVNSWNCAVRVADRLVQKGMLPSGLFIKDMPHIPRNMIFKLWTETLKPVQDDDVACLKILLDNVPVKDTLAPIFETKDVVEFVSEEITPQNENTGKVPRMDYYPRLFTKSNKANKYERDLRAKYEPWNMALLEEMKELSKGRLGKYADESIIFPSAFARFVKRVAN